MLPDFLSTLRENGYSVVTLRANSGVFDTPLVTAEAPLDEPGTL
jgi:hypothetical protein